MRRAVSIILFILAGWMLSSGVMMAWVDLGEETGAGARTMVLGLFALLAAPFLLGAIWASPGNRLGDLGVALMIIAAIGAALGLTLVMALNDPSFEQLLPPGETLPELRFAPVSGALTTLLLGGGGFLLQRWAKGRRSRAERDVEGVFD